MREPRRLRLARLLCGRSQPFGAGKLRNLLYPYELARRDAYSFSTTAKTGSQFSGNTADFHAYPFAVSGYSEWRNWAVALALCGPGDVIVEIGANVGTETVAFSDIVGSGGRVVAFEPLPSNREALGRVVDRFRHPNVTLLPYALGERTARSSFAAPPDSMSQGTGHLLGPAERDTGVTTYWNRVVQMPVIEVEVRPLDELAAEVEGVRLIVADAEGAEVSILRGARRVLERHQPPLLLEASKPHQRRAGLELRTLFDEVSALGYRAYVVGGLGLTEVVDPASSPEHSNWLCVPAARAELIERVRRRLRRCGLAPFLFGLNPLSTPALTPSAG